MQPNSENCNAQEKSMSWLCRGKQDLETFRSWGEGTLFPKENEVHMEKERGDR